MFQYIIFAIYRLFSDNPNENCYFAEMLRHESHNPVYNDSLAVEIQGLEWIQGQVQHLVNNRIRKGK